MTARFLLAALILSLAACSAVVERQTARFADDLETAIRQYQDPATVADALPAYLLLLEARLQASPQSAALHMTTAKLTGTHAALFGASGISARRLTTRALQLAREGACLRDETLCDLHEIEFSRFEQRVDALAVDHLPTIYVLATSWVSWIDLHAHDFAALADLPRVQALLEWVVERQPAYDDGAAWLYLAVLHSQRPPAAGGRPDLARSCFDRARTVSNGQNLLVDLMLADHYARLLFDRELFVETLEGVVESKADAPRYRLANAVARQRAGELLKRTEEIFD